ncbi:DUF4105 domain-containing protein [Psychrobacter sp. FDAARGOS_221]|uniref:Lnb N-terminal periplasmic domain-containing protein n=1 Tax=Psychrobacter sp. FDAARGOS_221 TaxID=1975705 RepID=UPI000BB571F1|nr:DUF4105 domain-containing protein [Psychrobacter sp. FDAARGOS_221]PNK60573.1 DUF4105 domain-containing protein [Psychrobacter sp. FDAARGOS_221]
MPKLSPTTKSDTMKNQHQRGLGRVLSGVLKWACYLCVLLAILWAGLVLWVHLNNIPWLRALVLVVVSAGVLTAVICYVRRGQHWQKWIGGVALGWLALAAWYVWLPAKQDRNWMPEVSKVVQFSQDASNTNVITLHNVRDFDWVRAEGSETLVQPTKPYYKKAVKKSDQDQVAQERWVERTVDLDQLTGVDIINSYWMGEQIGHTLLSFRFADQRPLSFSIEIRKEVGESFSTFGGFVKQFEMAVVAAEERDIVYTRSNVRGEQVYMFPVEGMPQQQLKSLFMAYLNQISELQQEATWYNTLLRNCTTVIFDMARNIDSELFPWDYRILLSGYVPNYLSDQGLLPNQEGANQNWDMSQWYVNAHINPKVADFSHADNQDPEAFSKQVRQGLPLPNPKPELQSQ